jgi:Ca-activated chloride channel family protein
MKNLYVLLLALACAFVAKAQVSSPPAPIIFIYDASGSMWGQLDGKTKMEIAANVLTTSVNKLPDNQKIGFVAYGHRKKGDCTDVEFLVDVENGTKREVNDAIKGIVPLGKTPLAYSAIQVIDGLRKAQMRATIILVTDGIESCDGNICDVIMSAKEEGIDFKLHIIGFGLKGEDTEQLKCAAKAGDGNYYNAADAGGLSDVLDDATSSTVDLPESNVSVYALKNGEPIDAWIKARNVTGNSKPISARTYRDTAYFYLPPGIYNYEVRHLEGSDVGAISITNVETFLDKIVHRTVSFDAGKLGVETTNNGEYWDCLVELIGEDGKVVAVTRTYQAPREVEVDPGTYKVTIQALAMEGMDTYTEFADVTIRSGDVTPLSYDYKTGKFQVYTRIGDQDIDAVVTVKDASTGTSVAGSRTYDRGAIFLLNPGVYQVKAAPVGNYKDKRAQTFNIEVKQGEITIKEIKF